MIISYLVMLRFYILLLILLFNLSFAQPKESLTAAFTYIDHGAYSLAQESLLKLDLAQMTSAEKREYHYYYGLIFFNKKEYKKAEASFNTAISFPSTRLKNKINYELSRLSYVNKDYGSVIKYINLLPEDSELKVREDTAYLVAVSYKELGEFSDALKSYQRLITKNVSQQIYDNALKGIAEIHFKAKEYASSVTYFSQLKSSSDKSLSQRGYYYQARSYFELGENHKAEQVLKEYLNSFSHFDYLLGTYEMLADIYFASKKYQSALAFYNELVKEDSYKELALYGQGMCFYKVKKYEQALQPLLDFIEISDDVLRKERAYYYLAYMNREIKKYKQSTTYLDILIASDSSADSIKKLSLLMKISNLYSLKEYQNVVDLFKLSGESLGTNLLKQAYLKAAESAYLINDFAQAISWLNNLKYEAMDVDAIFYLANSHFNLKQYEKAEKFFSEVLKRDDGSKYRKYVLYAISESYFYKEDYDWALAYCAAFFKEYSDEYYDKCLWIKAESLFLSRKYDESYQAYNTYVSSAKKKLHKAKSFFLMGYMDYYHDRFDQAITNFDNAISKADVTNEFVVKSQVYKGNAFFQKSEWSQAILSYKKVISNVKADNVVLSDVYVRIADSYRNSSQYSIAYKWYADGYKKYSDSKWAPIYHVGQIICLKKMSKSYLTELASFKAKYSDSLYMEPLLKELEK